MNLVTDTVPGTRIINTELLGYRLEVTVVVGILIVNLYGVVIHVTDRQLVPHFRQSHGLKLKTGHGAGGILSQRLVNAQADFPIRRRRAAGQMFGKDRLRRIMHERAGQSAEEIRSAIVDAVGRFRAEQPQADDITLVVIKALG